MPTKIIGTAPYQVPRNSDLGTLAVQDLDNVNIQGGSVTLSSSSTQGYFQDTAISDVKPSLMLDFANGKTLDPRITFTRSTTATYYDGKTTAMAEQNLVTNSQDFALWNKQNAIVFPNSTIAPDGTNTACTLVPLNGSVDYPCVYRSVGQANVTISVYAKAAGKSWINFIGSSGGAGAVWFNLSAGTIGTNAATGAYTASMVSVGNGWYRCSVFYNNVNAPLVQVNVSDSDNTYTVSGNGVSGVYIWGAQVEQRSGAGAYIATTSNSITNYIPALQTASAGTARFDHDPITGESKGLLIEEQRTNLCLSSNTFSVNNAPYNINIIANSCIAPDGTLTADTIYGTSSSVFNYVGKYVTGLTTTSTQINSVYAKAGTERYLWMSIANTGGTIIEPWAIFDLSTGTCSTISNAGVGMTPVGNGWYRCWIGHTLNATGSPTYACTISVSNSSANRISTGCIYVWGCQVEAGAFPTSYIPTTATQVTRSSDNAAITGNNFYSWYRQDEGTLYSESKALVDNVSEVNNSISISLAGASATAMALLMDTRPIQNMSFYVFNVGVNTGSVSNNMTMLGSYHKAAAGYAVNNVTMATDGVLSSTATNTNIPAGTQLGIGVYPLSVGILDNGYIKKIAYYPKRLSNAELQEITL